MKKNNRMLFISVVPPKSMSKWDECVENGFHEWNVDYYDDAYTLGITFSCNHCGATAETNMELEVVEP